jgi:hypothetical protein
MKRVEIHHAMHQRTSVSSAQREQDTSRDAFPVPTTLFPSVAIMLPLSSQMTYRIGTFCNDPIRAD